MKTLKFLTAVLASALVVSVCLTACSQKETVKEDTVVDVQTENTEETEKEEVIENPLGFNNVTFFKAVAECLGKEPSAGGQAGHCRAAKHPRQADRLFIRSGQPLPQRQL